MGKILEPRENRELVLVVSVYETLHLSHLENRTGTFKEPDHEGHIVYKTEAKAC